MAFLYNKQKSVALLNRLDIPQIGEHLNFRNQNKIERNKTKEIQEDYQLKELFTPHLKKYNQRLKTLSFDQHNILMENNLNNYHSIDTEKLGQRKEIKSERNKSNKFQNKLRINIQKFAYANPSQSLNIIKNNNKVFNEINKDLLFRQKSVLDNGAYQYEKNLMKFNVKMPKIKVSNINVLRNDLAVLDFMEDEKENSKDEKKEENLGVPVIPADGQLKLYSYFKYSFKNYPEGNQQFALCLKDKYIIISGGINTTMGQMIMWSLNIKNLDWKKIKTSNKINSKYGHTSEYIQNKIYFFGGRVMDEEMIILSGLEIYDFTDNKFSTQYLQNEPKSRRNHVSCLINGQMFIHGGIDSSNNILDDCHILNLQPLKWIIPNINSYGGCPKVYGHTCCLIVPNEILSNIRFNIYKYPEDSPVKINNKIKEMGIYIFGGKIGDNDNDLSNDLWILLLGQKPLLWKKAETQGMPPCPRYFHTMNYYEKGNFIIIHGGRNDNISFLSALNDTYVLSLENLEWAKIILYSNIPGFRIIARYAHKSCLISNKVLIFGGMNNTNYVGSSLFIINLDFNYSPATKTKEQLEVEELQRKNDFESRNKLRKLKQNISKRLSIVAATPIILPPIK